MVVRINTEEYVKTLKSKALVSINEEYSYVQPNVLFDNAFIYNKYSNITFRYVDDGYGFYNADGTLAVYCYGWRIEARDNKGNLVDFENGKLTQMGIYHISVYPASNMNIVEFAPVTLTVTLEEPFLVQNEPSKFLTDDLGKNVTLLKDGKVISERIAYYGTEKGYRFVAEDGSAIMEYDIELNLTNVKYGIANEQGAQAIYLPQAGNYMTVFNVTHVESEIKRAVVASLIIKPLGEYGFDNTLLNLTQRFEEMFTNINFGGAEDASLIYNADEDSYGVIAEDGTFVPMTLELTYTNNIVELKNGKINNFTMSGGNMSFSVKLIGSVDGVEYSVEQSNVIFRSHMSLTLGDLYFAGYVNGTVKITEEDGTVINANIVYDNGYKLKDSEGKVIEGYELLIMQKVGEEYIETPDMFVDGRVALSGQEYYFQIAQTASENNLKSNRVVLMSSRFVTYYPIVRWNPKTMSVTRLVANFSIDGYNNADYTFKNFNGKLGWYNNTTNALLEELTVKILYRENAESEWTEVTKIDTDGMLTNLKVGQYAMETIYSSNGITQTLMSDARTITSV